MRTKAEEAIYRAIGKQHGLHGLPAHRKFRAVHIRPSYDAPRVGGRRAPRTRRIRRGASRTSHGPPGRSQSSDDDPLDPPARVLYEHTARVADRRVARWLEEWADEAVEEAE